MTKPNNQTHDLAQARREISNGGDYKYKNGVSFMEFINGESQKEDQRKRQKGMRNSFVADQIIRNNRYPSNESKGNEAKERSPVLYDREENTGIEPNLGIYGNGTNPNAAIGHNYKRNQHKANTSALYISEEPSSARHQITSGSKRTQFIDMGGPDNLKSVLKMSTAEKHELLRNLQIDYDYGPLDIDRDLSLSVQHQEYL